MPLTTHAPTEEDAEGLVRPSSCRELFVAFTVLALQGFGGVLAVAQRELVERRRWLSARQFTEEWAVAQVMPGPNVVNLAVMLGDRYAGWRGALAAVGGLLLMPGLLLLGLAALHAQVAQWPSVQGALRGMSLVVSGLIGATALRLLEGLKGHPAGAWGVWLVVALTLLTMLVWRLPLIWVLLSVGLGSCLWTHRCLRRSTSVPGG